MASATEKAKSAEQSVKAEHVELVNSVSDDTKKHGKRGKPEQDDSQKVPEPEAKRAKKSIDER